MIARLKNRETAYAEEVGLTEMVNGRHGECHDENEDLGDEFVFHDQ